MIVRATSAGVISTDWASAGRCHSVQTTPRMSVAETVVLVTAVVGEMVLALYLVVRGVRTQPSATSEMA